MLRPAYGVKYEGQRDIMIFAYTLITLPCSRGGWSCACACCILLKNISHEPIGYNTKIDTSGLNGAE